MSAAIDPLVDPAPREVPLERAPLVRVLAQLRFPQVLSIEQREFVAPFQERIRTAYPVLRQEQTQNVLLGPMGLMPAPPQSAWRFSDTTDDWRVTLTPEFLTLETRRYTSRGDFFARLRILVEALEQHVAPAQLDRLGIRYIDRAVGPIVGDIGSYVRPEVRGIAGTSLARHAVHTLAESLFEVDNARLLARWGCLPANFSIDPNTMEPVEVESWILDLDMFSTSPVPFDVERLMADAQRYAERIYAVFRWAVEDQFLEYYGGRP